MELTQISRGSPTYVGRIGLVLRPPAGLLSRLWTGSILDPSNPFGIGAFYDSRAIDLGIRPLCSVFGLADPGSPDASYITRWKPPTIPYVHGRDWENYGHLIGDIRSLQGLDHFSPKGEKQTSHMGIDGVVRHRSTILSNVDESNSVTLWSGDGFWFSGLKPKPTISGTNSNLFPTGIVGRVTSGYGGFYYEVTDVIPGITIGGVLQPGSVSGQVSTYVNTGYSTVWHWARDRYIRFSDRRITYEWTTDWEMVFSNLPHGTYTCETSHRLDVDLEMVGNGFEPRPIVDGMTYFTTADDRPLYVSSTTYTSTVVSSSPYLYEWWKGSGMLYYKPLGETEKITYDSDTTDICLLSYPALENATPQDRRHRFVIDVNPLKVRWSDNIQHNMSLVRASAFYAASDAMEKVRNSIGENNLESLTELPEFAPPSTDDVKELFNAFHTLKGRNPFGLGELVIWAAKQNLSMKFGWGPSLQLLCTGIADMLASARTDTLIGRGRFHVKELPAYMGLGRCELTTRAKLQFGGVLWDADALLDLDRVGVLPTPSRWWETRPLTFIVDWFSGIGQRMARLENFVRSMRYDLRCTTLSYHLEEKIDLEKHVEFAPSLRNYSDGGGITRPLSFSWYVREVSRYMPFVSNRRDVYGDPSGLPPLDLIGSLGVTLLFRA